MIRLTKEQARRLEDVAMDVAMKYLMPTEDVLDAALELLELVPEQSPIIQRYIERNAWFGKHGSFVAKFMQEFMQKCEEERKGEDREGVK